MLADNARTFGGFSTNIPKSGHMRTKFPIGETEVSHTHY